MSRQRTGIYPGTFDPITMGHLDIINRASKLVDRLIVGVASNPGKGPLFSVDERCDMVREACVSLDSLPAGGVEVKPFASLLVQFAIDNQAKIIVRGLRAVSDFEYEFQMTGMNARLDDSIETVFLMSSERHQFISSRFVKEICRLGGEIREFVPANVYDRMVKMMGRPR